MDAKGPPPARLAPGDVPALARAWLEASHLKRLRRRGWLRHGVLPERCESVADHVWGTALLALLVLDEARPDIDRERVLALALVHDLGEVHAGDLTPEDGVPADEKRARERASLARVLGDIPGGDRIRALCEEFEAGETPESRLVRELDKLEMALQAAGYRLADGSATDALAEAAVPAIRTPAFAALLAAVRTRVFR